MTGEKWRKSREWDGGRRKEDRLEIWRKMGQQKSGFGGKTLNSSQYIVEEARAGNKMPPKCTNA